MKKQVAVRVILVLVGLALLLVNGAPLFPLGRVAEVEAVPSKLNLVTGLFRTFSAIRKRNEVYGEARATAGEINAYYEAQIAMAEQIRREKISEAAGGGKYPAMILSYVRASATLEQERQAMIEMVEAEKQEARRRFHQALMNEIRRFLMASPGAQSIMRDIRETIAGTRQAAMAVQTAVAGSKPSKILEDALNEKVGNIQVVRNLAQDLGSRAGGRIDRALGGIISKFEAAISDIEGGMGEAINLLDQFDAAIEQQQNQTRHPVSLVGNSQGGNLIPIDQANAGVDVAATAYGIAADRAGTLAAGETRQSMINNIREALQEAILTDIMSSLLGAQKGEIFCVTVNRAVYVEACSTLGTAIQEPKDSEQARYLVCYDTETKEPRLARLLESKFSVENGEDQEETDEEESVADASCFLGLEDFSWGYEDVERNDCTDPARCTGCLGTFVLQNNAIDEVVMYYYFYSNYSTPNRDQWHPNGIILKPGERWEKSVSINNRWKQGLTYQSNVVKVVLHLNLAECQGSYSGVELEKFAVPVEPMPCD